MNKVIMAFVAMILALPAIAFAQDNAQQSDKQMQQQENQAAEASQMGATTTPQHTMAGMVSNNGKTFTNNDKSYIVNNPKSLKNYDNQNVSVVFQFDPNSNKIHIIKVNGPQSQ